MSFHATPLTKFHSHIPCTRKRVQSSNTQTSNTNEFWYPQGGIYSKSRHFLAHKIMQPPCNIQTPKIQVGQRTVYHATPPTKLTTHQELSAQPFYLIFLCNRCVTSQRVVWSNAPGKQRVVYTTCHKTTTQEWWTRRTGMQVEPNLLWFQQANPGHTSRSKVFTTKIYTL